MKKNICVTLKKNTLCPIIFWIFSSSLKLNHKGKTNYCQYTHNSHKNPFVCVWIFYISYGRCRILLSSHRCYTFSNWSKNACFLLFFCKCIDNNGFGLYPKNNRKRPFFYVGIKPNCNTLISGWNCSKGGSLRDTWNSNIEIFDHHMKHVVICIIKVNH